MPHCHFLGLRVWDLKFRVEDSGFRVGNLV